jgi:hypothetical protein
VVTERSDAELEALIARCLGGEVGDARELRAARERVWATLRERTAQRKGRPAFGWTATTAFAVVAAMAFVVWLAWAQQYRVEVAQGGVPVLYREEVGRTTLRGADVDADIAVQIRHIEGTSGLRAGALIDVRLGASALPATIELRARPLGASVIEVIGRTAAIAETRGPTEVSRTAFFAPLPPTPRGETRRYEVWLFVETSRGVVESDKLLVEVTGRPEGERATLR